MSSYRKHQALFAGKWAAQCARSDSLTLDGVGVVQPTERVVEEFGEFPVAALLPVAAANKYGNKPTGGYQSKREAKRAAVLRLLEDTKVISGLREQVEFVLIPRQLDEHGKVAERACIYRADFVYTDNATGKEIVEDSKGVRTADYIIKRKLMRFTHGIVIKET